MINVRPFILIYRIRHFDIYQNNTELVAINVLAGSRGVLTQSLCISHAIELYLIFSKSISIMSKLNKLNRATSIPLFVWIIVNAVKRAQFSAIFSKPFINRTIIISNESNTHVAWSAKQSHWHHRHWKQTEQPLEKWCCCQPIHRMTMMMMNMTMKRSTS